MTFNLRIQLGRQVSPENVAEILRDVAKQIAQFQGFELGDGDVVKNAAEDSVGDWKITRTR